MGLSRACHGDCQGYPVGIKATPKLENNLFNCPNKNDTNNLKLQACLLEIDLIYERSCTCNAFSTRIKLASNVVVVVVVYIYIRFNY